MIVYTAPQGTLEWLANRKGVITASRFKDCRDKLKSGAPSKACLNYAMDVARERVGGSVLATFANAAMKMGTEQEPIARMAYEVQTGAFVSEAGFIATDDRKFGVSVDGRIESDGLWECKTMVSSDTLFTALIDGDISAYTDQCVGALWLLRAQWIDLHLWAYDMPHLSKVVRIHRDEAEIQKLEDDLIAFERLATGFEERLRGKANAPAATAPTPPQKAPAASPRAAQVPASIDF